MRNACPKSRWLVHGSAVTDRERSPCPIRRGARVAATALRNPPSRTHGMRSFIITSGSHRHPCLYCAATLASFISAVSCLLAGSSCLAASFFALASSVRRSLSKALSSIRSPVSDGFSVGCCTSSWFISSVIISIINIRSPPWGVGEGLKSCTPSLARSALGRDYKSIIKVLKKFYGKK
jgi:hypothetical protein